MSALRIQSLQSLVSRIKHVAARLAWLGPAAGGLHHALAIVLRSRRDPLAVHSVEGRHGRIAFRGIDEQALKEVLADEEYAFLEPFSAPERRLRALDVGAHIGTFAHWLLTRAPDAEVLSVEADPRTFAVLAENARHLQQRGSLWEVTNAAAASRDGETVRLTGSGPSMSHRVAADGELIVTTASLGSMLDRLAGTGGRVDIVKIDIEGSEEVFLAGALDQLARIDRLVIELHPNLCDTARVEAVLRATFDTISPVPSRISKKPLLDCRRSGDAPAAA